MLLLIGDKNDLTAAYMGWLAQRRGLATMHLAEDGFGVDWWANVDENAGSFELVVDGKVVPWQKLLGAFVRFNPEPPLPPGWTLSGPATELFIQERRAAISDLIEAIPLRTVNRPSAGRSNGAKPLHMAQLQHIGFNLPRWVASNDVNAVGGFLQDCPRGAVVKAASGLRSHVRMVDEKYLSRLRAGTTPSVVQEYVAGFDVRVHVVDAGIFGTRVDADVVDYRFDVDEARYSKQAVPEEVGSLCVAAARELGLVLAGVDFRVDENGTWWCLEINPVPTFLPYEASTGHPIGDCILDFFQAETARTVQESPLGAFIRHAGIQSESRSL